MKRMRTVGLVATCVAIGLGAASTARGQAVTVLANPFLKGQVSFTNYSTFAGGGPANFVVDSSAVNGNLIRVDAIPTGGYPGSRFKNWTATAPDDFAAGGRLAGYETDNPLIFFHSGATTYGIKANFGDPPVLTVDAPVNGTVACTNLTDGKGTVAGAAAVDPAADKGDSLRIRAYPATGYVFDHWQSLDLASLNGSVANPANFAGNGSNINVTAIFVTVAGISVSANNPALGDVTIINHTDGATNGPGPTAMNTSANLNDDMEVRATRKVGGTFVDWRQQPGNVFLNANNPYHFFAPGSSMNISATFIAAPSIVVSANDPAFGNVVITNITDHTSSGPGSSATDVEANNGDSERITAIPTGGKIFIRWIGDVAGGVQFANPYSFLSDGINKTIVAEFGDPAQIVATVNNALLGSVTITNMATGQNSGPAALVTCSPANAGHLIQMRALPASSAYTFAGWSGDAPQLVGHTGDNPLTILANGNSYTFTATFTKWPFNLMVSCNPRAECYSTTLVAGNVIISNQTTGVIVGPANPALIGISRGDAITVTPVPPPGWVFLDWLGDVPPGQEHQDPLTFLARDGDMNISVRFSQDNGDGGDFDCDGLPDWWEDYWGLDPLTKMLPNGTYHNPDEDYLPPPILNAYPIVPLDPVLGYAPSMSNPFHNLIEFVGFDGIFGTPDDPFTDPLNGDTDGDGMTDGWEYYFWGNAVNNTSMVGRAYDPRTVTGSLVIANATITNWFNPTVNNGSQNLDLDGDCLSNLEEMESGTDPINWDTDNDGMPDGWEIQYTLNPLDPLDAGGNPDNDWMARYQTAPPAPPATFIHRQVYQRFGYDPRTAWSQGGMRECGTGGPKAINTVPYTTLEEFRVARYHQIMNTNLTSITCQNWPVYTTDPTKNDTDGDGIADGWELYVNLNPCAAADSQGNPDDDGLSSLAEFRCQNLAAVEPTDFPMLDPLWLNKFWPTDPNDEDTDFDQIKDGVEGQQFKWATNGVATLAGSCYIGGGLNPTSADTDSDYLPDYWEMYYQGPGTTNAAARTGMEGTAADAHADYDMDGLENYQEYWVNAVYHFQYDPRIPPYWRPVQGFGGYDPADFFFAPDGRQPHGWDCRYFAHQNFIDPCSLWGFIPAQGPIPGMRLGGPQIGGYFASTDPRSWDSDLDGMDDYYEMYHGLNPLFGTRDLVHGPNSPAGVPGSLDIRVTPYLNGSQMADSDQDGLPNDKESLVPNIPDPQYYHTDSTPLWITDHSYELSWVNLYYWTGSMMYSWWWDPDAGLPPPSSMCGAFYPPAYVYSFEMNEGFDTDNDNVSDHDDLEGMDTSLGVTDALDDELPIRRRALKLNGDAAARTRGVFYHDRDKLLNFTVELWARPENPAMGVDQILIERPFMVQNNNPMGWTNGVRLNFRIALDGDGYPYAEYNGAGFDPTTVDPKVKGSVPLRADAWCHLAATYNGTDQKFRLYVNGLLVQALSSSLIPWNGYDNGNPGWVWQGPMVIGAREKNPDGYVAGAIILVGRCAGLYPGCSAVPNEPNLDWFYQGWIDEIRVWDGARSVDQIRGSMRQRMKRRTALPAMQSMPELLYLYTFDDLPDPDHGPVSPPGFSVLNGRPNDGSYPGVPWWSRAKDKSLVYNEYHYIPWIANTVAHIPVDPPADSKYWIKTFNAVGPSNTIVVLTNEFPNTSNPYNMAYDTGTLQAYGDHPDYTTDLRLVFDPADSALFNDLLPLRYAVADEDVDMWDGFGSGTNTMFDTDGDGLPDLWELQYGLDPYSASGEDGAFGDPDGDLLSNWYEYLTGNDPDAGDSDGDGVSDRLEDFDKDGLANVNELSLGTMPNMKDTDDDGVSDWEEVTAANDPVFNATRPNTSHSPTQPTDPRDALDPAIPRCMEFNGSARLIVPPTDKLMSENWTIEMWVYPTNATGSVLLSRYVQSTQPGLYGINYELGLGTNGPAGTLRLFARYMTQDGRDTRLDGTGSTDVLSASQPLQVPLNQWTHLAATYDSEVNTLSFYVNAKLAAYRTDATDVPPTVFGYVTEHWGDEVTIGAARSFGPIQKGYLGYIDEVRVWRKARTAAEILDIYNGVSVNVGSMQTAGPSYQELSSSEKQTVDQLLATARQTAVAAGGKYEVGYSPVLLRPRNHLCGRLVVPPPGALLRKASVMEVPPVRGATPPSFDWRTSGGLTSVKDQGACGACWAFSTVACMESAILRTDRTITDLSEQFLVSCNLDGYNCDGGYTCFDYFADRAAADGNIGAVYEADSPYAAASLPCGGPYNRPYVANSWGYVGAGAFDVNIPVQKIKDAIYQYGPVAVAVWVGPAFDAYAGGIFNANEVSPYGAGNHEVALVGWDDAGGYWIAKNQWGTDWGENGYIRIAYGTSGIGEGAAFVVYSGMAAGVAAELRFDDGGTTAQDFTFLEDWKDDWKHAAVLDGAEFATNTTPNLDKDTDGDGMPDWWEMAHDLDPTDGTGDNGAYGDPDGDELVNLYEFFAGTDPRLQDTDRDGYNDFFSWRAPDYRVFGEKYSDMDDMPDAWEAANDLDPGLYDAAGDPDGDGWSNLGEYLGSTDPHQPTNYPIPVLTLNVLYDGLNDGGDLVVMAYDSADMGGVPMAVYSTAELPSIPVNGELMGFSGALSYAGKLQNQNIVPGSLVITIAGVAFFDDSNGVLTGVQAGSSGTIDYASGSYTLTYTAPLAAGTAMFAIYRYRQQVIEYPGTLSFGPALNGHIREGWAWFFGFIDLNGSLTWDPGEPAGMLDSIKAWIGAGNVSGLTLNLNDQFTVPWYSRFNWSSQPGIDRYLVKVYIKNSTLLFTRWIDAGRTFFHENDYRRLGSLPGNAYYYGMPGGKTYEWRVQNRDGADATEFARGEFSVPTIASNVPSLLFPISESHVIHAGEEFRWNSGTAAPATRIRIGRASSTGWLLDEESVSPWRSKVGAYFRTASPVFGNGVWTNDLYRWQVATHLPGGSWTAWSGEGRFRVNLRMPPLGAPALTGEVLYFGKANGTNKLTNIVVQAFTSPSFNRRPAAQATLSYTCNTNVPTFRKGAFELLGLYKEVYYVRAFLDINGNGNAEEWEPQGFADDGQWRPTSFDLSGVASLIQGADVIIRDRDTDNDDLPDGWEWFHFKTLTNGASADYDHDGLSNLTEYMNDPFDSNPTLWDSDGDGLSDGYEHEHGLNAMQADTDGDGLNDSNEIAIGSDPRKTDTDGDGLGDGAEVTMQTSPLLVDTDEDGMTDLEEVISHTDPLNDRDYLSILSFDLMAGGATGAITVNWPGKAGVLYDVERTLDLKSWSIVGHRSAQSNVAHSFTDSGPATTNKALFYRISVQP